jgi:uncharacterized membrane protein YraQ (UPF0718 family)
MVETLWQLLVDFWATVAEMSPYLLFGFLVAGVLSVLVSQKMVERHLGGRGLLPVLKASLFGVPLPLCSCGVIPVAMSLRKHGASKGSTISFLLSTPQTGVDSILVTYSLLGPVFAVFRPLVAFVTGVIGGGLVDLFARSPEPVPESPKPAEDCCCCHKPKHRFLNAMKYGFVSLPRDIGKPLLIGLVIAALIGVIVPDDFFAGRLGTGLPAMLVMMAIGIPLYVCASASVPVAAALILKGLSPGAAFVFLMTGPATNAAGLATIWNTLGRRTAIVYLLTVAGCALASGLLLDSLISSVDVAMACHDHQMGPGPLGHLSAVILLTVLGYAFLTGKHHRA